MSLEILPQYYSSRFGAVEDHHDCWGQGAVGPLRCLHGKTETFYDVRHFAFAVEETEYVSDQVSDVLAFMVWDLVHSKSAAIHGTGAGFGQGGTLFNRLKLLVDVARQAISCNIPMVLTAQLVLDTVELPLAGGS